MFYHGLCTNSCLRNGSCDEDTRIVLSLRRRALLHCNLRAFFIPTASPGSSDFRPAAPLLWSSRRTRIVFRISSVKKWMWGIQKKCCARTLILLSHILGNIRPLRWLSERWIWIMNRLNGIWPRGKMFVVCKRLLVLRWLPRLVDYSNLPLSF